MTIKKDLNEVELLVSKALLIGVLVSASIIILGLATYLITGSSGYPGVSFPHSLHEVIEGLFQFKSYGIMTTGILLLILTPVFRVGISLIVFIIEGDKMYVKITAFVLTVLIISFFIGKV